MKHGHHGPSTPALPTNAAQEAGGSLEGLREDTRGKVVLLLEALLTEAKVTNHLLATGLNVRDDADALRADPYFNTSGI